ncbi:NAD(P)-binding domain-containing protein [Candidatus Saccharibacteria bacterium]|nr:NAD(P)-binding domain-containing protein [Candidatus Saccharibacteria bacterium]
MSPKIGIIGAGKLGTALARMFAGSYENVAIINSRAPDSLKLQLQILLPGVQAMEVHELIKWADIIILATPLRQYQTLPLSEMAGKIVVDAMNYWSPVDGKIAEFEKYADSSSELIAQSIPGARIVKTLNTVAYSELEEHALPKGDEKRRAIALAGDDTDANALVAQLIDAIGFDAVTIGMLKNGTLLQPDTELFNVRVTADEMYAVLDRLQKV